jgi:hypothetical protein
MKKVHVLSFLVLEYLVDPRFEVQVECSGLLVPGTCTVDARCK